MTTNNQRKVDETVELLRGGVEKITASEQFKNYLKFLSAFSQYSANNILLVFLQRPTARMVAGYRRWQELGRQVNRGEKAIRILAPILRKAEDEETGEEARVLSGFKVVSVYADDQTSGKPIPLPPSPRNPRTDACSEQQAAFVWDRLSGFCEKEGVAVSLEKLDRGGHYGSYKRGAKKIIINEKLDAVNRATTLCHEAVHHLLHSRYAGHRDTQEIEAEGAAFAVLCHYGLDTSSFSFPYLARYAAGTDKLPPALETIRRAAHTLIEEIGAIEPPDSPKGFARKGAA
jgi:hypothetical protein